MSDQVIVIGGGVVGLSTAWELAERGCRVQLFDSGQLGRAASWAAAGILPPANLNTATDPMDQLRGLSHKLYPTWVQRLRSRAAIDVGWRCCGGWYLASTPGETASMQGVAGYWQELEIECSATPLDRLAEVEPALKTWAETNPCASAWWVPDESQIQPPKLLDALAQACRQLDVELNAHAPVLDLRIMDNMVEVATGEAPSNVAWRGADAVIVCGGAWTGQLASRFGLRSSVVPIRGQMLLLKTPRPTLRAIVNSGQRYLVCREDGHLLVGSCEEETGFESGTTMEMLESLFEFACSIVPTLRGVERVDRWSGLRPMTMDGIPMIGRVPSTENLFVAAGHFRSGIHLAPATASIVADLVTRRQPQINIDAFRVGKQQTYE